MTLVALIVWTAAVVVYVALARWRGASWRSIAGLPAYAVSLAVVEFGVPPVVARHPGPGSPVAMIVAMVAGALLVSFVLWRVTRGATPLAVVPSGVAGSMAGAIDRARSSPHSAMPEPAAPRG